MESSTRGKEHVHERCFFFQVIILREQDGTEDERHIVNHEDVATENQKRMNSSPFEAMLLSMGYRELASMADRRLASGSRENVMQCRQS